MARGRCRRFAWAAVLAAWGCHPASRSQPEAAYQSFVEAVRAAHGGAEVDLMDRFDASTRAALQARAAAASAATGKLMPADPVYQALLGDGLAPAVTRIQVVRNDGTRAELTVDTDGGSGSVILVNEKGWKVHLDL